MEVGAPSTSSSELDNTKLTFFQHMMAGALAGIGEHVAMYPMDTIKTRMQALAHPGQQLHRSTVLRAVTAVLRREGLPGLYRGVTVMALGAGPGHALYFASYEAAKDLLGGNEEGHQPIASATAGAIATVINDAFMTPLDVIKQRLQVAHTPYRGIIDCITRTAREEGLFAFYKSYRTTLVMNVPYTAIHFAVYESTKKALDTTRYQGTLASQLTAGALAGGVASAVTNPLDVVKTRLQLEGVGSSVRYNTTAVIPMVRQILVKEGWPALWKGVRPRVLMHAPAAAICWGIYESSKHALRQYNL